MKITMYELLGMVKDGNAPKKIKYRGTIWYLEQDFSNRLPYYNNGYNNDNLLTGKEKDYFSHSLNDEVEILEEEKKIPEKLTLSSYWNGTFEEEQEYRNKRDDEITFKINSIIDYLKSKGDE